MSDELFYKKYLKYKKKYLELSKKNKSTKNNIKKGGWWGVDVQSWPNFIASLPPLRLNIGEQEYNPVFPDRVFLRDKFTYYQTRVHQHVMSLDSINDAEIYLNTPEIRRNIEFILQKQSIEQSENIFVDGMNLLRNYNFCGIASLLVNGNDEVLGEDVAVSLLKQALWYSPKSDSEYMRNNIRGLYNDEHERVVQLIITFLTRLFFVKSHENLTPTYFFITYKENANIIHTLVNGNTHVILLGVHSTTHQHNESDDLVGYYVFSRLFNIGKTCYFISGDNYNWTRYINPVEDVHQLVNSATYNQSRREIIIKYDEDEEDTGLLADINNYGGDQTNLFQLTGYSVPRGMANTNLPIFTGII